MSAFRNVQLKWKLAGVSSFLLALMAVEAVQAAKPIGFALLGVGFVIGGGITALMVAEATRSASQSIVTRMDAVDQAAKDHLMRGLQALAAGDLTVELHAATAASADFAGDELGQIQRHTEMFRDAIVACYDAYNADRGEVARAGLDDEHDGWGGRRRVAGDVLDLRGGR